MNPDPILYVLSGLPGSGKTTLAKLLSNKTKAAYIRIDTIEQGLRDLCDYDVFAEGYRLAHRIVKDNLQNRISVVADSCNPIALSRNEWEQVAKGSGVAILNIYLHCSDQHEHQRRIENRVSDIEGLNLPSWQRVLKREFEHWDNADNNLVSIDTSDKTPNECLQILLDKLNIQ